jgi:ubiquinone/menaquinone biosynthesis C-methylase UbiE
MNQLKNAWSNYEGNAWFERNKHIINKFTGVCGGNDFVINVLENHNMLSTNKILEIGSSAGYRLNSIKEKHPKCELYGIDPSTSAIEFGKANYRKINLTLGTVDELPFEKDMFDVVIVGFVFYTIDRELLFQSVAEIDRVLKNTGFLIIVDFFSQKALRNQYAHICEFQAYAFKQRYEDIFTSSHLYHLMDKTTLNHVNQQNDIQSDFYDLISITLLKKEIDAAYK